MIAFKTALLPLAIAAVISLASCKVEITKTTSGSKSATATTSTATASSPKAALDKVRVMTYNIQNLKPESVGHGDRIEKLKQVIQDIKPTVACLQEVADRATVNLVFPEDKWLVIIDDDSDDEQDVAVAIRRPWKALGVADDLDAEDENFLAGGGQYESFFPNRRDGLFVQVASPDGSERFTVVSIHAKARVGGRSNSESRREGSSRVLVDKLKTVLKDKKVVLMGDFNDTPDDASLNILETGNAQATGAMESDPDTFMINLTEPLWAKGQVTIKASANRLDKAGLINNVYAESRERNHTSRGRDTGTGPLLLDNVLISQNLKTNVSGGAVIYRNPLALTGSGFSRPSDHLPVYIDIKF